MKATLRSSLAVLFAAAGLASAAPGFAAEPLRGPGSDARMQRERAVCDGIQQDRAACLREAGAAREAARRGGLVSASPQTYEQNALARCTLQQTADDRAACEARVRGTGRTEIEGSVMGGGLIRETVTPISAPMQQARPMQQPMPMQAQPMQPMQPTQPMQPMQPMRPMQ
ncbi:hypothetical protein SRS16CHR_01032 [Variovorax sp. SRS16]|uniref:hypothetical protein n=1 Tax=Variovorax sp. SRS16 TaxID=282217 RepID=UPI00131748A9|nr:hypothetical protein [Variovorax sp. SRS16]VTU14317.1 hypothetical protein SRS16CHR_01032 [Variovorax sp. SRS16]